MGLDYADQRYYASTYGRFNTPDPYKSGTGSGSPADPGSWNKYAYVEGDPINEIDPTGEFMEAPPNDWSFLLWSIYGGFPQRTMAFVPADPPAWQDEWDNLSEECQKGLRTKFGANASIQSMTVALNRAVAQTDALTAAGDAHGVDPALLGAIGLRETGFRNINQPDGQGTGIFQIDLGKNPSVTAAQASDPTFAADWAANYLSNSQTKLESRFPGLTGDALIKAVADSYNEGLGGASRLLRNGQDPDSGTTGKNYGSNILNLTKCFN